MIFSKTDKDAQKGTLLNWLGENYLLILYTIGILSLATYQIYLLIHKNNTLELSKFDLHKIVNRELLYLIGLNLWLLILGLIDIKRRIIPLWLNAPIILGIFIYRFFETAPLRGETSQLVGLGIGSFYTATGICLGFAIFDGITHFGNWMAKFAPSTQGLMAIWNALPFMIIGLFIPPNALWVIPASILVSRIIFELAYSRINFVSEILNRLCKIPWLTYVVLLCFVFISFYLSLQDMYKPVVGNFVLSKPEITVYSLSISYILEELIIPFIQYLVNLYKKEVIEDIEEEKMTVMGGGDAILAASLGAILGPFIFLNCVQITFFLVFLFILCSRLIDFFKKKLKATDKRKEIPLAPFAAFSLQIIVIYSILA